MVHEPERMGDTASSAASPSNRDGWQPRPELLSHNEAQTQVSVLLSIYPPTAAEADWDATAYHSALVAAFRSFSAKIARLGATEISKRLKFRPTVADVVEICERIEKSEMLLDRERSAAAEREIAQKAEMLRREREEKMLEEPNYAKREYFLKKNGDAWLDQHYDRSGKIWIRRGPCGCADCRGRGL
jgi:hypothetical protein